MSRRVRRMSFTAKERILFAEEHGRTCSICKEEGLMTESEIKEKLLSEGKYVFTLPDGSEVVSSAYLDDPLMKNKVANIDHKTPISRGGTEEVVYFFRGKDKVKTFEFMQKLIRSVE